MKRPASLTGELSPVCPCTALLCMHASVFCSLPLSCALIILPMSLLQHDRRLIDLASQIPT